MTPDRGYDQSVRRMILDSVDGSILERPFRDRDALTVSVMNKILMEQGLEVSLRKIKDDEFVFVSKTAEVSCREAGCEHFFRDRDCLNRCYIHFDAVFAVRGDRVCPDYSPM